MLKIRTIIFLLCIMLSGFVISSCVFAKTNSESNDNTCGVKQYVYFKVPSTSDLKWDNTKTIYCHIWQINGDEFFSWQTNEEKCTHITGNLWKYDLSKLTYSKCIDGGIESDIVYAVVFSDNNGNRTYDLYFTDDCIGDTVYFESKKNQVNDKRNLVAHWKNHTEYGMVKYGDSNTVVTNIRSQAKLSKELLSTKMTITILAIFFLVVLIVVATLVGKNLINKLF